MSVGVGACALLGAASLAADVASGWKTHTGYEKHQEDKAGFTKKE